MRKQAAPPYEQEQDAIAKALFQELSSRNLRYYIVTYGCQMNAHDSERIAGMLESCGFVPAESEQDASMILFNTCCIREHAEKRVFGNIGALKKRKDAEPGLIIGICGCMMQQKEVAERLYKRFPFVNFVFGTHSLHLLPSILQQVMEGERPLSVTEDDGSVLEGIPVLRQPGVSASINITYGCNNYCSYCIVPYVRGRERSREPADILFEAAALIRDGYSELMLLGQNVNSYHGSGAEEDFAWLLRQVNALNGIRRIRFMTSHPKDLSDALITAMAECKSVCSHLHLPVQSGSDRILAAMNRRYTRAQYKALVERIRAAIPDISLTTDIIVGFPGETEQDFLLTVALVEEVGFSAAYTFMYSPRAGTKAATLDNQVEEAVKKERLLHLNAVQEKMTRLSNLQHIGSTGEVLVEGCDNRKDASILYGKLDNAKMVYFPGDPEQINRYVLVRVDAAEKNSLIGRQLPEGNT